MQYFLLKPALVYWQFILTVPRACFVKANNFKSSSIFKCAYALKTKYKKLFKEGGGGCEDMGFLGGEGRGELGILAIVGLVIPSSKISCAWRFLVYLDLQNDLIAVS